MYHQTKEDSPLPRIRALIEKAPRTLRCDQCIANSLRVPRGRRGVWRYTKHLADDPAFTRQKGICPVCGDTRMLIGSRQA